MDKIGDYLDKQLSQTQKESYQMLPLIVDPDFMYNIKSLMYGSWKRNQNFVGRKELRWMQGKPKGHAVKVEYAQIL